MAEDDVIQLELQKERRRVTKAYQSQQRRRERNLQQLTPIACRRVRSLPEDEEISLANEWAAEATLVSYGSALVIWDCRKTPASFADNSANA
jgi:hypothetical protein